MTTGVTIVTTIVTTGVTMPVTVTVTVSVTTVTTIVVPIVSLTFGHIVPRYSGILEHIDVIVVLSMCEVIGVTV